VIDELELSLNRKAFLHCGLTFFESIEDSENNGTRNDATLGQPTRDEWERDSVGAVSSGWRGVVTTLSPRPL
jgi:hypothetical protein